MTAATLLLTIEEAAMQLKVSTRTLRRLIDAGDVSIVPIGGAIRVPFSTLTDFVNNKEQRRCRTDVRTQVSGGSVTRGQKVVALESLLAQRHKAKQKPLKQNAG